MKQFIFFLNILFILSSPQSVLADPFADMPEAPKGYTWVGCHGAALALLKPDAWFFKEESHRPSTTLACFITKEDIDKEGHFSTGFTVNIVSKFSKSKNGSPVDYAKRFVQATKSRSKSKGGIIHRVWQEKVNSFQLFGIERTESLGLSPEDQNPVKVRLFQLAIGNEENDSFILLIFESLASDWDSNWPIAEPVAKKIGFNPDKLATP